MGASDKISVEGTTRLKKTPAQVVDILNSLSLRALKKLWDHLPHPEEELERQFQAMGGLQFLEACICVIVNHPNTNQSKACRFMLGIFVPDWQSIDPKITGLLSDRSCRNSAAYYQWRQAVLNRDDRRCRKCGTTEKLNAHHILPWEDFPTERFNVDNGVTLCVDDHKSEHANGNKT